MVGFIKLNRSEHAEHLHRYPSANHLLSIIAYRARRTDHPVNGLKSGQCYVGDYASFGLTRAQYRTALSNLQAWHYITTRSTNKGTIATIINTDTYDINEEASNQQIASEQPASNQQSTTNKECKNVRMEEVSNMFDLFWSAGMRKTNKKGAVQKFNSLANKQNGSLENWTQTLITDIQQRLTNGQLGFDQMHPTTYLNGERWNDEQYKRPNQPSKQCTQDILRESQERDQQQMRDFVERTFGEDNSSMGLDGGNVQQQMAAPMGAIDGEWTTDSPRPKLVRKD